MELEFLPITLQLANLANPDLTAAECHNLCQIIDSLYRDLSIGHRCTILADLEHRTVLAASEITTLLVNSGLAHLYQSPPQEVAKFAISIVELKPRTLIYLSKYLAYELSIAAQLKKLSRQNTKVLATPETHLAQIHLSRLREFSRQGNRPNLEQLAAIERSCQQQFSIITGGPGTGKTTTVALLLWLMYQIYGVELKVRICAPTGKAAIRVRNSLENSINLLKESGNTLNCEVFANLLQNLANFGTLHKLLGYQTNSIYFRHNARQPLDVEVLIVDESSMIGLPLFSKLLQAINPDKLKHIVLLGDKNQLSSVEEGYVFAAMIKSAEARLANQAYDLFNPGVTSQVSELKTSNRNIGDIASLATAILAADWAQINKLLLANAANIKLIAPKLGLILAAVLAPDADLNSYLNQVGTNSELSVPQMFKLFNRQCVLCLTNSGLLGSDNLNRQIEMQVRLKFGVDQEWYTGRPIMILSNDYNLELFNGDIGICRISAGKVRIIFENGREFIPEVLPEYKVAYAITIHKSQGSEYAHVFVVLPEAQQLGEGQKLLSRELVYTAITRAKTALSIFSSEAVLAVACRSTIERNCGLDAYIN